MVNCIKMCVWWHLTVEKPALREVCRQVLNFTCSYDSWYNRKRRIMCDSFQTHSVEHLVSFCSSLNDWRMDLSEKFYNVCLSREYQHDWLHHALWHEDVTLKKFDYC